MLPHEDVVLAELGSYISDYLHRTKRMYLGVRLVAAISCYMFVFSTLQLSHASVLEYVVRRNLPSQADKLAAVVKELVDILGHSPLTVNLVHFARCVVTLELHACCLLQLFVHRRCARS